MCMYIIYIYIYITTDRPVRGAGAVADAVGEGAQRLSYCLV